MNFILSNEGWLLRSEYNNRLKIKDTDESDGDILAGVFADLEG